MYMQQRSVESTVWKISLWVLTSLFYTYQYILRVMPSAFMLDFTERFHMSSVLFGQFAGSYYLGYALIHLPLGMLLNRIGLRAFMSSCLSLSFAGLLPLLWGEYWVWPTLGRFLTGMGSSASLLCILSVLTSYFPKKYIPSLLGASIALGLLGAVLAGHPLEWACQSMGYRPVIISLIVLGVMLMGASLILLPRGNVKESPKIPFRTFLSNGYFIGFCLCSGLFIGCLEGFTDVWGSVFLQGVWNVPHASARWLCSLIFVSMGLSSPILGMISEKKALDLELIALCGIFMMVALGACLMWDLPLWTQIILFVLLGVGASYKTLSLHYGASFFAPPLHTTAAAFVNAVLMMFGYGFHGAIGSVVKIYGGPGNKTALTMGVSVVFMSIVIGWLGFMYMILRYKQPKKSLITPSS